MTISISLTFLINVLTFIIKPIFKSNIEFHKILESFPLISEHRVNDGTKIFSGNFTNVQISNELTEFVETKKGNLDEFLAKLEKFDESKLKFKKKEITSFIRNIKRLLKAKAYDITTEGTLNLKTNEFIASDFKAKPIEWAAQNYYMANMMMKDQEKINELYVFKKLKF